MKMQRVFWKFQLPFFLIFKIVEFPLHLFSRLFNSTNIQKPERFFYLPKEIVQELKFQGNSNHFCLSSRICEIFRKFKKEICSKIVDSNFSRHYGVEKSQRCAQNRKIRVFRTGYFGQSMNSGKHEFCDSLHTVGIFEYRNAVKS